MDGKRARELQGFLDGVKKGQEQVLGWETVDWGIFFQILLGFLNWKWCNLLKWFNLQREKLQLFSKHLYTEHHSIFCSLETAVVVKMCLGSSRCRHWWQAFWFFERSLRTELHTIQEFVELDCWTRIEFVCLSFSETFPWSCVTHLPVIPWSWVSWGTCRSCWARMLYPEWAWVQITHNCWDC